MSPLRRFVAALSGALLLQLTLLGSGTLCTMHDAGGNGHHGRTMAGMSMAGDAPAAGAVMASASAPATPGSHRACDATSTGDDCRSPWGTGQCISMTTCSATAAPAITTVGPAIAAHLAAVLSEPAAFHSGPGAAPELPPPRA